MTRNTLLLAVLGAVLLIVLWFLFAFKPASDELADVNAEIQAAQDQQQQLETQIQRLQAIRADVTTIEAELAAYNTVIPDDPALPALLRELQVAADDSGLELRSVAPGETPNLARTPSSSMSLSLRRSSITTRRAETHCARSLSGEQMWMRPVRETPTPTRP